jgi:hypothetical protein
MENTDLILREVTKIVMENRNMLEVIMEKQAEILSQLNKTDKGFELNNMNERLEHLQIVNEEILSLILGR